jgi:CHAT domain-containing protein
MWSKRALLAFTLVLLGLTQLSSSGGHRPAASQGRTGTPHVGELSFPDRHRFRLDLAAGEYLKIRVEHEGIDVGVALITPEGSTLASIDYRQGSQVMLSAITASSGTHVIEVRSLETSSTIGRYLVVVEERHSAAARDVESVKAGEVLAEAEALFADSPPSAVPRYRTALEGWKAAGDQSAEALAARKLGEAYLSIGKLDDALPELQDALRLSRLVKDTESECAALIALGRLYLNLGKPGDAADHATRALRLSETRGFRLEQARALNVLGNIDRFSGRTRDSLARHETALSISTAQRDRRGEAEAMLNLGHSHTDLGDLADGQHSFETARDLWREVGERRGEAPALVALGQLHFNMGESQIALDYFRQAKKLLEQLDDPVGLARVHNGIGYIHARTGDPETAINYFREAVELCRNAKYRNGEAANLLALGNQFNRLKRYDDALQHYLAALDLYRRISNRRQQARTLKEMGDVNAELKEPDKAFSYYRESRLIAHEVGHPRLEVDALTAIGELFYESGRYSDARKSLNEALMINRQSKSPFDESQTLFILAKTEAALGNGPEALTRIRESLALVEDLRTEVASLDLRASYLASVRDRHELEVELLMRLAEQRRDDNYVVQAVDASERARARSFLDDLSQARGNIREGVSTALLDSEASIRRGLNAAAERLTQVSNDAAHAKEFAARSQEVDRQTAAYKDVEAQIRAESPRYASLMQPQPLKIADVQELLTDKQTVLLQYFLGKQRSYLWAVTQNGLTGHVLPPRAEIEERVRTHREALSGRVTRRTASAVTTMPRNRSVGGLTNKGASSSESVAGAIELSKILLGPVAEYLSSARVLIVADGILQALPFSTLPDPRALGSDRAPMPLIAEHEVINLPSMSTLALLRGEWNQQRRWQKAAMVFADPVYHRNDPRLGRSANGASRTARSDGQHSGDPEDTIRDGLRAVSGLTGGNIPRLIETSREARGIGTVAAPADLALGFDANRDAAMTARFADYRIVHFAAHGIVDDVHPELSGIVLSLFDRKGKGQDGFLRLHDIYNLKIPADLVVLSACSTGLGKDIVGEGFIGLVRGFMYAGSRRVVASLWEVDDEATSQLMTRFYRYMFDKKLAPAAALRAAQLDFMKNTRWKAPFYWAGFVLQGDWN